MSKIKNTSSMDFPDLLLMAIGGSNAIERQEKQGQDQLAKSSQLPAKNNGRYPVIPFYESLGIKVIGETPGDPMFLDVILPEGWKVKPTDHSMWSGLIDPSGVERASIFYKAAFYDREAFIDMHCRYTKRFGRDESVPYDVKTSLWRYTVIDNKTGETIFERPFSDYGTACDDHDIVQEWIAERYPDFKDPTAYWND